MRRSVKAWTGGVEVRQFDLLQVDWGEEAHTLGSHLSDFFVERLAHILVDGRRHGLRRRCGEGHSVKLIWDDASPILGGRGSEG